MGTPRSHLPALLLIAVIIGACSGGKSSSLSSPSGASLAPGTSSAPDTSLAPGTTSVSSVTAPTGGSPTSAPRAGTTSAPTATSALPPGTKPAAPAQPGSYKYRQSGTSTFGSSTKAVPGEGTLRVDPVTPAGNQTWHRAVDPAQPASDTVFSFRGGRIFLTQLVMRSNASGQTQTFTCTFNPGVPSPPWPPTVGETYQGHGDCGSFTVDVHGTVQATRNVSVGGVSHKAYVLVSTLAIHGQIEGSGSQTDWLDPVSSLILHEETAQQATYGGVFKFSGSTTSDLESTKPAA